MFLLRMNPFVSLSAEDFRQPPRAAGAAHQVVEPPQSAAVSRRRDIRRGRAAARRQLPPAEDHRQGQLRQSQTGQTHSDGPRGEPRHASTAAAGRTQLAAAVTHRR